MLYFHRSNPTAKGRYRPQGCMSTVRLPILDRRSIGAEFSTSLTGRLAVDVETVVYFG
jgi:hypothetical protein